jgi:hypothetical protein
MEIVLAAEITTRSTADSPQDTGSTAALGKISPGLLSKTSPFWLHDCARDLAHGLKRQWIWRTDQVAYAFECGYSPL